MSKKTDAIYYQNFINSTDCSCRAARLLHSIFENFNYEEVIDRMKEMHAIENEADKYRHDISELLADAFITPLERDDIMKISHHLDDIVDALDDALMRVYMYNVKSIKDEAVEMIKIVIETCDVLKQVTSELQNFKKSTTIRKNMSLINSLENQGDKIFLQAVRKLYVDENISTRDIIIWKDIYNYLERCIDSCEKTIKIIEIAMLKNS